MNRETLRKVLVEQYDYKHSQVDGVLDRIEAFSAPVAEAFAHWLATGELNSPEIAGYTVQKILETQSMKPVAAYIQLQWLEDEPERALRSLRRGPV
jgi:hypothetical protein